MEKQQIQPFSTGLTQIEDQWCDCTVEYDETGIHGRQTKMTYIGDAKFKCPVCGRIDDLSKAVYKVRLEFKRIKDCKECNDGTDCGDVGCKPMMKIKILEPVDPRLLQKWDSACKGTIQEALQDDLDEWANEDFESFKFVKHKEGIFDVELLYNYYRCSVEYEEYDLNLRIIAEKELLGVAA